ncbi:sialyltransferase-like protein [Hordeum vulgare]|nr:sialyltransferase-like protein [Hordeum vulgare]
MGGDKQRRDFPNLAAAVAACIARGHCVAASSFPNAATKDAVRASAASAATKDAVLRPFRENRALKIISGLQNFDRSNVASVIMAADKKDPITGESEGLAFEFNLCEDVASWEQVRNSTTILTKEYIDALQNGWEEYAWRRINQSILL